MRSNAYLALTATALSVVTANPQPQFDPAQILSALPAEVSAEAPFLESALPKLIQSEGGELLAGLSSVIAAVAPTNHVSDAAAASKVITAAGAAIQTDLSNILDVLPQGIIPPEIASALSAAIPQVVSEAESGMSQGLAELPGSFALSNLPSFLSQYLTTAEQFVSAELPALVTNLPAVASEIGQLTAGGPLPTGLVGVGNNSVAASSGAGSGSAGALPVPTGSAAGPSHIATGAAAEMPAWSFQAAGVAALSGILALM